LARNSKAPDFEQALTELEALTERLERGDLPLDEALKLFERGVALTRHCQSSLQAAQQKVEILLKRGGELQAQAFEEPEEEGSAGAPEPQ
jgi:exodeoxyribonuclease VII small subunit